MDNFPKGRNSETKKPNNHRLSGFSMYLCDRVGRDLVPGLHSHIRVHYGRFAYVPHAISPEAQLL